MIEMNDNKFMHKGSIFDEINVQFSIAKFFIDDFPINYEKEKGK